MRVIFIAAVCAAFAGATGLGQEFTSKTPENTVAAYLKAQKKGEWREMIARMHPDAMSEIRRLCDELVATAKEKEEIRRQVLILFDIKDLKEIDGFSGESFAVRFLEGITKSDPGINDYVKLLKFHIVGSVKENDDLVHVVIRTNMKLREVDASEVTVISVKRSGEEWRVLLSVSIQGAAKDYIRSLVGGR